ncbi:MAG TPA: hypothetical protein VN721_11840 [Flavipsychrobacter sp.]|nr:hypothetical protein [Flavipsychrobacter sp.]
MKCSIKFLLLPAILICYTCLCFAQQEKTLLRFYDKSNNNPLGAVSLFKKDGEEIAKSDSAGYATVMQTDKDEYLIALKNGYSPDTIYNFSQSNIYLAPLTVMLNEATINGNEVHRVLRSAMEYVVDYAFVGDNILMATYSGNNGKRAKIFLMSPESDTLAMSDFPEEPLALFRSCIGKYYCVCWDKLYQINISLNDIKIDHTLDIKLLPALKLCQQCIDGNLYYKVSNYDSFFSTYSLVKKGDSVFYPFTKLTLHEAAEENLHDLADENRIMKSNYKEAQRIDKLRRFLNRSPLESLNYPLFSSRDSLIIFDFQDKSIQHYSMWGENVKNATIRFPFKELLDLDLLKDDITNRFYLYRNKAYSQTIEEVNINTGEVTTPKVRLQKPFATDVKVHNGDIYYLWQDGRNGAIRQLFVQKSILYANSN